MSDDSQNMERSTLERKDRAELAAVAGALGLKVPSRAKKADIVGLILDVIAQPGDGDATPERAVSTQPSLLDPADPVGDGSTSTSAGDSSAAAPSASPDETAAGEAPADAGGRAAEAAVDEAPKRSDRQSRGEQNRAEQNRSAPQRGNADKSGQNGSEQGKGEQGKGDQGRSDQGRAEQSRQDKAQAEQNRQDNNNQADANQADANHNDQSDGDGDGDGGGRNRRRRRRGRDRVEGEGNGTEFEGEPVEVSGLLDLRDDGYGFLRVAGFLPSRDDVYVSVKQCRQLGLRKGDHLTGLARPAGHKEKNPALTRVETVNGMDPEQARNRPRFDDLTPLFSDSKLALEGGTEASDVTGRIIDLIAPIGKGQRGLIVSPPRAGKTTIMKTIARAIEQNHPDVHLIVLLIDERPEEVTDFRRSLDSGEVVASTFDRPAEEHTAVAELTIEHAKRLVEYGHDVVIILDGITRLARAYNMVAPAGGRTMPGGIDTTALYPPKKFFGAARNVEEGGSLTILATAAVDTGSVMDTVIFEEFEGTANMELRLDRDAAEQRVYPAISVEASSTRHEELLFDSGELDQVAALRQELTGVAGEGHPSSGLGTLLDRLGQFPTNEALLGKIAKSTRT